LDIARGEQVEHELDAFIRHRDKQRRQTEGERLTEELWMPSERSYFARLEDQKRQERLEYHEAQAARLSNTLGALVTFHQAEATKYRENGHNGHDKVRAPSMGGGGEPY
jgi:hypothetical protein